jgi:hypothetical protein
MVDKMELGQVFSEYFSFPCQFSVHQLLHADHLSFGAGKIGQLMTNVPSGLSHPTPRKKKDLREIGRRVWTGFIWLTIGTSGGTSVNMEMNLQIL